MQSASIVAIKTFEGSNMNKLVHVVWELIPFSWLPMVESLHAVAVVHLLPKGHTLKLIMAAIGRLWLLPSLVPRLSPSLTLHACMHAIVYTKIIFKYLEGESVQTVASSPGSIQLFNIM